MIFTPTAIHTRLDMIDDLFDDAILELFFAHELDTDDMHLTPEEVLACAGLIIAVSPKWSAQRDVITNLMLNLDEESVESVLMFLDTKVLDRAISKC